jgi:hypothetical protein
MPTPPRHLRIVDALVLVAATAAGFAWIAEWNLPQCIREKLLAKYSPTPILLIPEDGNLSDAAAYLLAPWAIALVLLRLPRPRPRRQALLTRPGFVATGVATAVILQQFARFEIENLRLYSSLRNHYYRVFETTSPTAIAMAIVASWSLALACGRWHPEASWIDRAGRAVGVGYIIAALGSWTGWPVR